MTEHELLIKLQTGEESAFKTLVETHQKRVFNTVLAIIQNFEEAEDVSQEVFMEVYQSVGKFRGESKISTWLYRIATTKALDQIRKKKTVKRFAFFSSLFGENNEIMHESVDFVHPGILLEQQENAKVLFKAINQLPENQKVAFTLSNIEGLSYQEITEVMDITLSSVESLLFRAKTNLRKSLGDFYKNKIN
jgi:RNA polymerase sigma-70 factor (ECF subfamily)